MSRRFYALLLFLLSKEGSTQYALYQPISKREICLDIVKNKAKVRGHQVNGMLLELAYLNNFKTFHRGFSDQSRNPSKRYKIVFTR